VSDGTLWITIWQAQDPTNATSFDRKNNIGLHHLALLVDNHAALDSLHERLQQTADLKSSSRLSRSVAERLGT
jgi:hypothetical protein